MRLGNTGGKNKGKKYLKITGGEPITPENRAKAYLFDDWFENQYANLKRRIISQDAGCNEDVLHETYWKIRTKILYGGLEIKDFSSYFHRSYFTNNFQISIQENKQTFIDLGNVERADDSPERIMIMKEQDEKAEKIKDFIKENYPDDYDLFIRNTIDGETYVDLSRKMHIGLATISKRINRIKDHLRREFSGKEDVSVSKEVKAENSDITQLPELAHTSELRIPDSSNIETENNFKQTIENPQSEIKDSTLSESDMILQLINQKKVVPYSIYEDQQKKIEELLSELLILREHGPARISAEPEEDTPERGIPVMKRSALLQFDNLVREKTKYKKLEQDIITPDLQDLQTLPTVYEWVQEISSQIKDYPKKDTTEYKHLFIYIALMLYSPRFFAGEFLIRGLRDELAKLFDLSPSHISNLCRDVPYKHRSYSNFQRNADYIIEEILFRIKSSSMDRQRKNVLMSS